MSMDILRFIIAPAAIPVILWLTAVKVTAHTKIRPRYMRFSLGAVSTFLPLFLLESIIDYAREYSFFTIFIYFPLNLIMMGVFAYIAEPHRF